MSTRSLPLQGATWLRPKYLVFAFIFAMMAYVLNHNERFLINSSDPVWSHYRPFQWWLLPHGMAAACALLLGPMQFSDRLRQRYVKFHHVVGYLYVIGVVIGAPIGSYIQFRFDEHSGDPRSFSIATVVDAVLWITATLIALQFARRGKITLHRQWMTRSYAVAIAFLEIRVISGLGGLENVPGATEAIVWFCVGIAYPLADVAIQWPDLWPARKPAAKKIPAATQVAT